MELWASVRDSQEKDESLGHKTRFCGPLRILFYCMLQEIEPYFYYKNSDFVSLYFIAFSFFPTMFLGRTIHIRSLCLCFLNPHSCLTAVE